MQNRKSVARKRRKIRRKRINKMYQERGEDTKTEEDEDESSIQIHEDEDKSSIQINDNEDNESKENYIAENFELLNIKTFGPILNLKFKEKLPGLIKIIPNELKFRKERDIYSMIWILYDICKNYFNSSLKKYFEYIPTKDLDVMFKQVFIFMHSEKLIEGDILSYLLKENLIDFDNINKNFKCHF